MNGRTLIAWALVSSAGLLGAPAFADDADRQQMLEQINKQLQSIENKYSGEGDAPKEDPAPAPAADEGLAAKIGENAATLSDLQGVVTGLGETVASLRTEMSASVLEIKAQDRAAQEFGTEQQAMQAKLDALGGQVEALSRSIDALSQKLEGVAAGSAPQPAPSDETPPASDGDEAASSEESLDDLLNKLE
ncbi:MAG: hypothetical protein AAGH83_10910 [Pseudomonadota bacterium]